MSWKFVEIIDHTPNKRILLVFIATVHDTDRILSWSPFVNLRQEHHAAYKIGGNFNDIGNVMLFHIIVQKKGPVPSFRFF